MLGVRDVRFAYRKGAEELFGGLTHDFAPGRVTALTGASGRGKSTLLYLVGLLLTPTGGQVLLDGEPVSEASDAVRAAVRARRVGFVFQDSELDPSRRVIDSVLEPALYAGHLREDKLQRARALLEQFGLGHRADHRPGQVSGGQAQRLAVCRALLLEPDIVLADEPTGNLDADSSWDIMQILSKVNARGTTVLVATHDRALLHRYARRVIVLEKGRLHADGMLEGA